jgi:serine/threonine-protein kinase
LTDFGIAKARNFIDQDEERVLMGKVEYMSPEQADYQVTDARSDLFSLGIVYSELLTGNNNYIGYDTNATLERVKKAEIPKIEIDRKDIPADIVKIVNKSLQKDPANRYQSASEMGYELEYQMYSKGYGPTIGSLAKYASEIFPRHKFAVLGKNHMPAGTHGV